MPGWQPHTVRGIISSLRKGRSGRWAIPQVKVQTRRDSSVTTYVATATIDG
jgi:hypothetical protein